MQYHLKGKALIGEGQYSILHIHIAEYIHKCMYISYIYTYGKKRIKGKQLYSLSFSTSLPFIRSVLLCFYLSTSQNAIESSTSTYLLLKMLQSRLLRFCFYVDFCLSAYLLLRFSAIRDRSRTGMFLGLGLVKLRAWWGVLVGEEED